MSSKLSIAKDLRPMLIANEELSALVGNKIFPLYATGDTTGDFILYQRTDGGSEQAIGAVVDEWCDVTFNVVSENYVRSVEIAEKLRSVLQDTKIDERPMIMSQAHEDYIGVGNVIKYVQIMVFSVGKPEKE